MCVDLSILLMPGVDGWILSLAVVLHLCPLDSMINLQKRKKEKAWRAGVDDRALPLSSSFCPAAGRCDVPSHQEEGWLDECRSPGAVSWVTACTLAERRMRRPAATGFSRAVVFFLPPCSAFGAAAADGWIDGS